MIYLIVALVVLDAGRDALYDRGKKTLSGVIDLVYLTGMICGVVLLKGEWEWILVYGCLRYILFDPIYNLLRGVQRPGCVAYLFYVGTTKPFDILLRKIFNENVIHFLFITRLMALVVAGSLIYVLI